MEVQSLGQENALEKEMATHSSILAWTIPWTEEPGELYSPWGRKDLDTTKHTHILVCIDCFSCVNSLSFLLLLAIHIAIYLFTIQCFL